MNNNKIIQSVIHHCNTPFTLPLGKVKAEGLGIQGWPWLYGIRNSWVYKRPQLKKLTTKTGAVFHYTQISNVFPDTLLTSFLLELNCTFNLMILL